AGRPGADPAARPANSPQGAPPAREPCGRGRKVNYCPVQRHPPPLPCRRFVPLPSWRSVMKAHLLAPLALGIFLPWPGPAGAADAAKFGAVPKELEKLQGTWQLVAAETDGKKAPDEQVKQIRVVIRSDRHTVYFANKVVAKDVPFQIDPTQKPKTTDDTLPD